MAHNNQQHTSFSELDETNEYLQPKLEQQPYILPSSAYGQASSLPSSSSKHTHGRHIEQQHEAPAQARGLFSRPDLLFAPVTNGFFGTACNGNDEGNVDDRQLSDPLANKPDNNNLPNTVVRYTDDMLIQHQQPHQSSYYDLQEQPNFDDQQQQQIVRAENASSWFSWLPSTSSLASTSSANPGEQQTVFAAAASYNNSANNTVLINSILESANMGSLPVDINSAYEANRIQIQDVYRAVEFEMHRRLAVPVSNHNGEPPTHSGSTDNVAKNLLPFPPPNSSSSPTSSSLPCFHNGNNTKLSNLIGVGTDGGGQQNDSTSWLSLLQNGGAMLAGDSSSVGNLPSLQQQQPQQTSAYEPPVFFGTTPQPPNKSASSTPSHTDKQPAGSSKYVSVWPSTSHTINPPDQTMPFQNKTFQKPLHHLHTAQQNQQQQRRSLTTPISGTQKKRTAVFSQFTGVHTTVTAVPHNSSTASSNPGTSFAMKKIKTETNSSSSDAGGGGVDDEDGNGDDNASETSYSNLSDINGRAVAAVLAPLARTPKTTPESLLPATSSSSGIDARDNVLVCYTFWRLALVKKVRREVTLGEIRRRLAPPESFTLSQLGSLLRLAKVRGSGPALKQRLEHYGLKVESSQRTQARQTLFMALLESEANTMAHEYKTLCVRHFPRRSLAEYFVHKRHTQHQPIQNVAGSSVSGTDRDISKMVHHQISSSPSAFQRHTDVHSAAAAASAVTDSANSSRADGDTVRLAIPDKPEDLTACADTLAELRTALLLDRSPSMASEPANNNQLPSVVQNELNNFSASTHGFGTQTIVHHLALLEDVLKFMARCYSAQPNLTVPATAGASSTLMNDFEPESAMLMHPQQQPLAPQHW